MDESFKSGKRFFVLEGPTGFGKSPVAKTFLNAYESGVITTPLNQLVGQYTGDEKLAPPPLSEVCGKSNYQCSAFNTANYNPTCEEAEDAVGWRPHADRCVDYVADRNRFWGSAQGVTNPHFLYYAQPPEGAYWPRSVLVVDEAHQIEDTLIKMGERTIWPKTVKEIGCKPFDFPLLKDKVLLDTQRVGGWLTCFSTALGHAISRLDDEHGEEAAKRKRKLTNLRDGILFTLDCGDWICWMDTNKYGARELCIIPMSARKAAAKLFQGFDHVLFASATIGNVNVFLRGLGIEQSQAGVHVASCDFPPENRPIFYNPKGSLSHASGQSGFAPIMRAIREVLQRHPDERGIIHCHAGWLRDRILADLSRDLGARILTHGVKGDRDDGVERLRGSENGVLLSLAMTEGIDLEDDDARFCIFPKVPWPYMGDPYVKARMNRDPEWFSNQAAIALVQGSGRIVRHAGDYGETFIFDNSFAGLVAKVEFPDWWLAALTGKRPPLAVTTAAAAPARNRADAIARAAEKRPHQ
jgi:Rad3-related DNA helicase